MPTGNARNNVLTLRFDRQQKQTLETRYTMTATVYLAIHEDGENKYLIEYQPAQDGAVVVVSVSVQKKLIPPIEQVERKRRRGIVLTEDDQINSDMMPYKYRENRSK